MRGQLGIPSIQRLGTTHHSNVILKTRLLVTEKCPVTAKSFQNVQMLQGVAKTRNACPRNQIQRLFFHQQCTTSNKCFETKRHAANRACAEPQKFHSTQRRTRNAKGRDAATVAVEIEETYQRRQRNMNQQRRQQMNSERNESRKLHVE